MADYEARLFFDPLDTDEPWVAGQGISEIFITDDEIDDYATGYEPTEGCTP